MGQPTDADHVERFGRDVTILDTTRPVRPRGRGGSEGETDRGEPPVIDALGEVTVTVEVEDGQRFTGRGVSTDIVDASARAYLDALDRSRRLEHRRPEFRP